MEMTEADHRYNIEGGTVAGSQLVPSSVEGET